MWHFVEGLPSDLVRVTNNNLQKCTPSRWDNLVVRKCLLYSRIHNIITEMFIFALVHAAAGSHQYRDGFIETAT